MVTSQHLLSVVTEYLAETVIDQGAVDVDFSGASVEEVNRYLPPIEQPQDPESTHVDDTPCPPINVVIHVVGSRGMHYPQEC